MTQQNGGAPEIEVLSTEAMTKTELFFEENGKKITVAIFALFVLAAVIFGYKSLIMEPAESKASAALFPVQAMMEGNNPDYQVVLDGNNSAIGLLNVIDQYGSTAAGNLAKHYAGVCYLKLNNMESAASYLKKYKATKGASAEIINAQNVGLQGDIAVDNGDYAAAIALYEQAVEMSDNMLTAPIYMRKAGVAAVAAGDEAKARDLFEAIVTRYPMTYEANTAQKYLGTLK